MKKHVLLGLFNFLVFFEGQQLVAAKIKKNVQLDGTTQLIEAVKINSKSKLKKALKVADINFVDKFGKTAMDYAVEKNNKKFIFELAKQHALVTTDSNRLLVKAVIQQKINAYKGAGIAWILAGPAAIVGGTGFLARRGTWKTVAAFYDNPKASLV